MKVFASRALLEEGWADDVQLVMDSGKITEITPMTQPDPDGFRVDTLLPALSNLHSHSFQRAMAGMTEFRVSGRDSFWTWRDLMYRFLDHLTPTHIGAIASMAFMEMQKTGFAAVGEFHYLHHAPRGRPYDDPAALSAQVFEAAAETGIGLTHLPVLYSYGDVGRRPLVGEQLRFGNTVDQFTQLVDRCKEAAKILPEDTIIGIAPHSLRATSPADLARVIDQNPTGPIHIHIAEQTKEVESVSNELRARPVEWLLDNTNVDRRWCLIHATHMTECETRALARSGAVAGLCPVTEANLGDGVFKGLEYLKAGGTFGIGTDSNVNIALAQELRSLEYSQRLIHRQRNVLVTDEGATGASLYTAAARGGAQALHRDAGSIAIGKLADLVAIDSNSPRLFSLKKEQLLDGYVFAVKENVVTDVWSAGRHQIRNGQHVAQEKIYTAYRNAMTDLASHLG